MAQPRAVTTSTLRPRAAVRKHWRRRPPRCVSKPTACTVLSRGDASTRQHCQHHRDARDARERLMQAGTMLAPWPWLAPRESAAGAVVSGAWLGKNPSLPLATLLLRSRVALPVGPLPSPDAHRSQASHPKSTCWRRVTNTTFALGGARVGVLQTARQGGIRDVHLHVAC